MLKSVNSVSHGTHHMWQLCHSSNDADDVKFYQLRKPITLMEYSRLSVFYCSFIFFGLLKIPFSRLLTCMLLLFENIAPLVFLSPYAFNRQSC